MKLTKDELKELLNTQTEWHLDNAEFLRSQGFSGKENDDLYERYEALLNKLEDGTLEIEGYERNQWTRFDPNDESTYPPNKTHVLVYGLSDNMRDDEKLCGLDVDFWLNDHFVCYRNITHWRPLPPPPTETEAKK